MIIIDKRGAKHDATFGKLVQLDGHEVTRITQTDSVATLHGFALPPVLQGVGIGSALLKTIEQQLHRAHVITVKAVIPFEDCPIHAHFWTQHGYRQHKNVFTKQL